MKANKEYQKAWYDRQKNTGLIYLLTCGPHSYVGSTTNSLTKRLWQHKSGSLKSTYRWVRAFPENTEITLLEVLSCKEDRYSCEQKWIDHLKPSINMIKAKKPTVKKDCYNGGFIFKDGKWYPTLLELWRQHGRIPYGTFKSRLHRSRDMEKALGLR